MKAAWDWFFSRGTEDEDSQLVSLAAELGFDTLIIHNPDETIADRCRGSGLRPVAVISPVVDDDFIFHHPEALQSMLPVEREMDTVLSQHAQPSYQQQVHWWYPLIQRGSLPCYEHQETREYIGKKIEAALSTADGIALDGFGFKNHYACHCPNCCELCRAEKERNPDATDLQVSAEVARRTLVDISEYIYTRAKEIKPDCLVTNHIWPPFNPDPYYGRDLRLDFCTQTISWFYRPNWSLEMVRFEASEHARLQRPERNRFVPFIGLFWREPYQRRTPERIEAELQIALEVGKGSITFCTLEGPWCDEGVRSVLKSALHHGNINV